MCVFTTFSNALVGVTGHQNDFILSNNTFANACSRDVSKFDSKIHKILHDCITRIFVNNGKDFNNILKRFKHKCIVPLERHFVSHIGTKAMCTLGQSYRSCCFSVQRRNSLYADFLKTYTIHLLKVDMMSLDHQDVQIVRDYGLSPSFLLFLIPLHSKNSKTAATALVALPFSCRLLWSRLVFFPFSVSKVYRNASWVSCIF